MPIIESGAFAPATESSETVSEPKAATESKSELKSESESKAKDDILVPFNIGTLSKSVQDEQLRDIAESECTSYPNCQVLETACASLLPPKIQVCQVPGDSPKYFCCK